VLDVALRDRHTLTLTLARPEAHNALSRALIEALTAALVDVDEREDVRAVVLAARGPTFAAGGDLKELRSRSSESDAALLADLGLALVRAIASCPVPVVAALDGPAIGGGAELALACDLRVASHRAALQLKHVRMGATPAWGTTERVVRLAGPSVAGRMLFLAATLSADEALAAGLVDRVVREGTAEDEALAWARAIGEGAPDAVRHCKALIQLAATGSAAVAAEERARFIATWSSEAHREAVSAFFEGRRPEFGPPERR
jgi:enoyl-CoA hydratase